MSRLKEEEKDGANYMDVISWKFFAPLEWSLFDQFELDLLLVVVKEFLIWIKEYKQNFWKW